MNGLPILPNVPGKVFYDYEAQNNIYSLTAYSEDSNTILVLWHTDQEIDQDKLLEHIHYVNDLTIKTYHRSANDGQRHQKHLWTAWRLRNRL